MEPTSGVSVQVEGDSVIIAIEHFPVAIMIALDEDQAFKLGAKLVSCAEKIADAHEPDGDDYEEYVVDEEELD